MTTTPYPIDTVVQPTEPGWYRSVNGSDYLIYLRLPDIDIPDVFVRHGAWKVFTADGDSNTCDWDYIAQAGPITPLIKEPAWATEDADA